MTDLSDFPDRQFCPACARPIRSVWAGWKRSCIPGEPSADGVDGQATACISRKVRSSVPHPFVNWNSRAFALVTGRAQLFVPADGSGRHHGGLES